MSRVTVFTVDELVEIVLALRGYNGSEHSPPGLTKHGRRALSDRIADDLGPVGSAGRARLTAASKKRHKVIKGY